MRIASAVTLGLVWLLSTGVASAGTAVHYVLKEGSQYWKGCFPPCQCAMTTGPLAGGFDLVHVGSDPLFDHYDIADVSLVAFPSGPSAVGLHGSGTYTVGGEVAFLQRFEFDLSSDGGPIEHFDSGWMPVPVPWPSLDGLVSLHGMVCLDTALHIVASPSAASPFDLDGDGAVSGGDLAILLGAWGPCPPPTGPVCGAADFNGDGAVDAADLAALLAAWSP